VFGKQNYGLVGWPDRIAAHPLMNLETYEASFSIEFGQALDGHATAMVKDFISGLEVPERCLFKLPSTIVVDVYHVFQTIQIVRLLPYR
jgi:hypothetical protein